MPRITVSDLHIRQRQFLHKQPMGKNYTFHRIPFFVKYVGLDPQPFFFSKTWDQKFGNWKNRWSTPWWSVISCSVALLVLFTVTRLRWLIGALITIRMVKTLYWLLKFIRNRSTNPETSCATVTAWLNRALKGQYRGIYDNEFPNFWLHKYNINIRDKRRNVNKRDVANQYHWESGH